MFLCSRKLIPCVLTEHPCADRNGKLPYSELRDIAQFLPPDLKYSSRR